ncbi:MAG: S8 family serine peptidase [Candidatus Eisenbacteria bacterium]|uniref:S8 family serine peptidase n=1 Tax=Eiseniibacteriota bacterium TaxID=2212470 RepID=A0A948RYA2_UNCEI|nr:S8 family serine peptidase [Candidatus Eisenbacteria bacterium]MBU1949443.1 S8 family serine peptidase [Candidatus Eisenbacteria bacterium]MBU2691317.1 S8 family serine peptidase [Candidatus Eisenbacteria bacterium]
MRRAFPLLVLILIVTCTWSQSAPAGRFSPELEANLLQASDHEKIPILIILERQADPILLRMQTDGLAPTERRAIAARHIKRLAKNSQVEIVDIIDQAVSIGKATPPHSFWILNGVRTTATKEIISDLILLPEVNRIIWDPPIPVEQQIDDGRPERGLPPFVKGSFMRDSFSQGDGLDRGIAWQLDMVNAPEAWGTGYTGAGVIVGVVDTGVDYTHPDLAGHIWVNVDEIQGNEIDDDENGYVDDTIGWDFVADDNNPNGTGAGDHGTRVAGLIVGDGTTGTQTGVAPGCTIMLLRGSGGTWSDLVEAMEYAVDNGAHVISMSVTQKWRYLPKPDFSSWRTITDNELAMGIFHANSVGNEGDNINTDPIPFNISAPGNCPAPWVHSGQSIVGGVSAVVGCGSITYEGYLGDFSSRGPSIWEDIAANWPEYPYTMLPEYQDYPYTTGEGGLIKPDICAPSPNTITTEFGGGYSTLDGTSASTPQVAGAMAILIQAKPGITPEEMTQILLTSATKIDDRRGIDNNYGAGLLDVQAALQLTLDWNNYSILSGVVFDASSLNPVPNADVTLFHTGSFISYKETKSRSDGSFVFVIPSDSYNIVTDEFYYLADTTMVTAPPGPHRMDDILIEPRALSVLTGIVRDSETSDSLEAVTLRISDAPVESVVTDTAGVYVFNNVPIGRDVLVVAVRFGHLPQSDQITCLADTTTLDFYMPFGVMDDFEMDQGWTVGAPGDDAYFGLWERIDPAATYDLGVVVQPEDDFTVDPGVTAFITGGNLPGAGSVWNDVDGGTTTLLSPIFDLTRSPNPLMRLSTWYSNHTGAYTDDAFTVDISADSGQVWTTLDLFSESHNEWEMSQWILSDFVDITNAMQIRIVAWDGGENSTVEVGIDELLIFNVASSVDDHNSLNIVPLSLSAMPNPFTQHSVLSCALPRSGRTRLDIINVEGRRVRNLYDGMMKAGLYQFQWDGRTDNGLPVASGCYFAQLIQDGTRKNQRLLLIR